MQIISNGAEADGFIHFVTGGKTVTTKLIDKGLGKLGDVAPESVGNAVEKIQGTVDQHPRLVGVTQGVASRILKEKFKSFKYMILAARYEVANPGSTSAGMLHFHVNEGFRSLEGIESKVQDVLKADDAQINVTRENLAQALFDLDKNSKACLSSAIFESNLTRVLASQIEIGAGKTPKVAVEDTDVDSFKIPGISEKSEGDEANVEKD